MHLWGSRLWSTKKSYLQHKRVTISKLKENRTLSMNFRLFIRRWKARQKLVHSLWMHESDSKLTKRILLGQNEVQTKISNKMNEPFVFSCYAAWARVETWQKVSLSLTKLFSKRRQPNPTGLTEESINCSFRFLNGTLRKTRPPWKAGSGAPSNANQPSKQSLAVLRQRMSRSSTKKTPTVSRRVHPNFSPVQVSIE